MDLENLSQKGILIGDKKHFDFDVKVHQIYMKLTTLKN